MIPIDSDTILAGYTAALTARCPVMARLHAAGIRPPLRRRAPGFAGLVSIIVSQQVSTASAAAIWSRIAAAFDPLDARAIATASDEALRACALSQAKMRTFRAVAEAEISGALALSELGGLPADAAHARLTAIRGIGPWTADIYLMFCLGHPDAFAAGDVALQEAARLAHGLETRPDAPSLARLAEAWRPHRAVAARMLWAYYRVRKAREGVPL